MSQGLQRCIPYCSPPDILPCAVCFGFTDSTASLEKAWIELESVEAIVKTASKAKFFIEFHSLCLEGTFTSVSFLCLHALTLTICAVYEIPLSTPLECIRWRCMLVVSHR